MFIYNNTSINDTQDDFKPTWLYIKNKLKAKRKLQSPPGLGKTPSASALQKRSIALKGKPQPRCCRISDQKEMSVSNFKKYDNKFIASEY
jgi:hypothetical protein